MLWWENHAELTFCHGMHTATAQSAQMCCTSGSFWQNWLAICDLQAFNILLLDLILVGARR